MISLRSSCRRGVALVVVAGLVGFGGAAQAADITVSAAASLTNALQPLAPLFEAAHPGDKLQFNFGASGALLQQIAKGAPVDAFISADQETLNQAQAQGLIASAGRRNIASNTLVLIVPVAAPLTPTALNDLTLPAFARIAIGVPASVPVGRYTRSELEAVGLWAAIEPKVIGAQSVRQALDYVARGEVDAGFVYATDAALMPGKVRVALTVPTTTPILYPAAAIRGAPNAALGQQFVDFLISPPAQAVLAKFGFGKP
ncbi:MAG: molybdate ABC transporter substrate-binding protein [Leptothrix sp. (in: b-proteobacteria)]